MNPPVIPHDALIFLDYLGIAVFAISGALVAAERRLDFVTFIFFAVVTGVGGGTLRDLLIGAPVFWVSTNATLLICIGAALAAWLVPNRPFAGRALLWFDAAGMLQCLGPSADYWGLVPDNHRAHSHSGSYKILQEECPESCARDGRRRP